MKICRLCQKPFTYKTTVDGKVKRLSNSRTACIECRPFGKRTHGPYATGQKLCKLCGRITKGTHTKCNTCETRIRKYVAKQRAIMWAGGKCQKCGLSVSLQAFHFHHRNPKEKEFALSQIMHKSWKTVVKELQKCDLVCANCHAIEHEHYSEAFMKAVEEHKNHKKYVPA